MGCLKQSAPASSQMPLEWGGVVQVMLLNPIDDTEEISLILSSLRCEGEYVELSHLCQSSWFQSWVSHNSLVLVETGHGDIGFFPTGSQGSENGLSLGSWVQCQDS